LASPITRRQRITPAGLTIEEIEQQQAEIDRLNAAFRGRFRIFKGIESDILPDGSLDYPDDVLRRFDFIIGSIHGQFRLVFLPVYQGIWEFAPPICWVSAKCEVPYATGNAAAVTKSIAAGIGTTAAASRTISSA
jgi:hypothetical protein